MAQDKQHLTTEQLSALLDREISASEQAHWEAHLSTCPQCQQALTRLRQTVTLLHALPQPMLPRSFVLPVEAAGSVALPRRASVPIPIRPARRRLNPYVRGVLRTMSALAAVIGVVFFLSGLLPALVHGGTSSSTINSAVSGSVKSPARSADTVPHSTQARSVEKTLTPAISATAIGSQVVQPQPTSASNEQHSVTEQPTSSSWPTFFIFNLSTSAGRLGLGMILVILGIMGFVLFKRARRETGL